MTTTYQKIIKKLQQESTWRGLFALLGVLGAKFEPDYQSEFILGALTIIGFINIIKNK